MKYLLDLLNSRLEMAKERVSELENRVVGIIYSEEQKRLKNENRVSAYGTILKYV